MNQEAMVHLCNGNKMLLQGKETLTHAMAQMNLKHVMLYETRQIQMATNHMISIYDIPEKAKVTGNRPGVPRG